MNIRRANGEEAEREVYTTGQVSRFCRVSAKTVKKWFDSGKIPGYRIPDSGDRRVTRESLLAFMKKYDIPTDLVDSQPLKVLAVDDEPQVLEVVSRVMGSRDGMEVRRASNGYAALLLLGSWLPDMVIMDLKMPGLDGFEACRRIRALPQTQGTKLLVISAYATADMVERAKNCGADDFLAKPFNPQQLEEVAFRLLDRPFGKKETPVDL